MLCVTVLNDVEPLGKVKVIIDQVRITDNDFEIYTHKKLKKNVCIKCEKKEGVESFKPHQS